MRDCRPGKVFLEVPSKESADSIAADSIAADSIAADSIAEDSIAEDSIAERRLNHVDKLTR